VLEAFLIRNPLAAVAAWAALYASDYYLTLWGARLYKEVFSRFVDMDGSYELEPIFQKDIDALRRLSPAFALWLFVSSAALLLGWWLSVKVADMPSLFLTLFGGFVLVELVVHARHVRNIRLFRLAREGGAIEGHMKYARWVTERVSVTELLYFAAFYAVCFALSSKVLFLGGVLGCLASARRHGGRTRRPGRTRPTIRAATPADAPAVARIHVESWQVAYRGIVPEAMIAKMDLATRTRFWAERIAKREWPVFVIAEAGEMVAFCQMVPSPDPGDDPRRVGHITSIHVLPHLRSRGYGRSLLDHAFAEFRRRRFTEVTLWVLEENASARRFYEKLGFHHDGGRKTYPGSEVPEVRYRITLR
jgi:ribosomal protein S18 acetylase RimI-like enzyme